MGNWVIGSTVMNSYSGFAKAFEMLGETGVELSPMATGYIEYFGTEMTGMPNPVMMLVGVTGLLIALAPPAERVPPSNVAKIRNIEGKPSSATIIVGTVVTRSNSTTRSFIRVTKPLIFSLIETFCREVVSTNQRLERKKGYNQTSNTFISQTAV